MWKINLIFNNYVLYFIHCPKRLDQFPGRKGNVKGNPSDGRKLFMLIFFRSTMKISEKANSVSRKTGKLFFVFM
jgi:hypothetical protein